ncbi:MAG: TIGR01777 family protein [Cytophagales bacterium]|nr:TIGR01777 family protein [Cytophaga sp.]
MKVLITGGSGLVGSRLTELLTAKGIEVVWLSRKAGIRNGIVSYEWSYKKKNIDPEAFNGVTHIIHLAGAGVFDKRWTDEYKKEIIDSRIETTKLLFEHIESMDLVSSFISGSAIGWYGNRMDDKRMVESDAPGSDFLANVTKQWEAAADVFTTKGIRTVKIRIGIVLAKEGGALPAMLAPVKLSIGSPLASGKQMVAWIHIDDLCGIFMKALEDTSMQGVYNGVAPNPLPNALFMRTCADVIKKPFFMPRVPALILELILGKEKAMSLIQGINVSSEKVEAKGYAFKFRDLAAALKDILD